MYGGRLTIAAHNTELIEEIRHYHRDHDYRVSKQRDDLISALRYAVMSKHRGKPRWECDGIGFGQMPYAGHVPRSRSEPEGQLARGIDFQLF